MVQAFSIGAACRNALLASAISAFPELPDGRTLDRAAALRLLE